MHRFTLKIYLMSWVGSCIFVNIAWANACPPIFTIGEQTAYDKALQSKKPLIKVGPLKASDVPPQFPRIFLEADGSYGGGEALASPKEAIAKINVLIKSGVLAQSSRWEVYTLEGCFDQDTYELHPHDFRINKNLKVTKKIVLSNI